LVFWWLAVDSATDDLDSGLSTFFDLDFSQVALAVIGLGLMSSLLSDLSRELGKLLPSLVSGAMLIMCGLYVIEPLAIGLLTEQYDVVDGAWRCLRLGILWAGVSWCAHLLVDASLLVWLKRFCDSNGIEVTPHNDSNKGDSKSSDA
jgi:xanthine/uracil permease